MTGERDGSGRTPGVGRKPGRMKEKRERNGRIREAFDGFNHEELAAEWGLSVRQIYRIVNDG